MFQYIGVGVLLVGGFFIILSTVAFLLMVSEIQNINEIKPSRHMLHPGLRALMDGSYLTKRGFYWRNKCILFMKTGLLLGFVGFVVNICIGIFLDFIK